VSSGFFEVVRPRLVFGRTFSEAEREEGAAVIMVSESLWRLLGARIDQDLQLDIGGRPNRVIGVVAEGPALPTEISTPSPSPAASTPPSHSNP
jgi:hypothetical protein